MTVRRLLPGSPGLLRRRGLPVLLAVFVLASIAGPRPALSASKPGLSAYRGLGTWVDIYDDPAWTDPEGTVAAMGALGIRTLFLETSNWSHNKDVLKPDVVARFIEAAHQQGMRAVGWYLPSFADLEVDFRRSMAAIDLETPAGQRFDSFGLDIEATVVADPSERTDSLLRLSARIREAVGPSYPLGAIIPNPVRLETYPDRWPGFPYQGLAQYFDAFVPMGYFAYDTKGTKGAHDYTARIVELIRERTGDPSAPIHLIGGIASDVNEAEARGFVHAVREHGVLGASLYDFLTSGPEDWAEMATLPVNPRQSPALPVDLGYAEGLGNFPKGDRSHPKEVFYRAGGMPGVWEVSFEAFDVQRGELTLSVNWHPVAAIPSTHERSWGKRRTVQIPDEWLRDGGTNYIAFQAAGDFPDWSGWGVRAVALGPVG